MNIKREKSRKNPEVLEIGSSSSYLLLYDKPSWNLVALNNHFFCLHTCGSGIQASTRGRLTCSVMSWASAEKTWWLRVTWLQGARIRNLEFPRWLSFLRANPEPLCKYSGEQGGNCIVFLPVLKNHVASFLPFHLVTYESQVYPHSKEEGINLPIEGGSNNKSGDI